MTIRNVQLSDSAAIAEIYNHYITNTTVSFETEPLNAGDMKNRIASISKEYPYFVCEIDGQVAGYCYAHEWKSRKAYCNTWEVTVYVSVELLHRGIGKALMVKLIDACRKQGAHVLISCITAGNEASFGLHESLGFKKVSTFHQVGCKFNRWLDIADFELILD